MVQDPVPEAVRRWREAAPDAVLLDGFHALKHALRFGARVRAALAVDLEAVLALAAQLAEDVAEQMASAVVEAPAPVVRQLVPRLHPTGVAALAERPGPATAAAALDAEGRRAPVVVLDNPRHMGNIGAVVRLAAGMGAAGVITTGDADPWHPAVVRAAAGLHYATAVQHRTLHELPPGPLYVLDPAGEDIHTAAIPDDALLAFGSERHGVSASLRSRATALLAIPMHPEVSSFNLATTVAMTLFHWSGARRPSASHSAT